MTQCGLNFLNSALGLLHLGGNAAAAVILTLQLFFDTGNVLVIVLHVAAQHSHLAVQLLMGGFQHVHLQAGSLQIAILLTKRLTQLLRLGVQAVQFLMGLLQHKGCRGIVLLCLFGRGRKLVQRIQPNSDLHTLQLVLQLQILLGLFGLHLQGLQL